MIWSLRELSLMFTWMKILQNRWLDAWMHEGGTQKQKLSPDRWELKGWIAKRGFLFLQMTLHPDVCPSFTPPESEALPTTQRYQFNPIHPTFTVLAFFYQIDAYLATTLALLDWGRAADGKKTNNLGRDSCFLLLSIQSHLWSSGFPSRPLHCLPSFTPQPFLAKNGTESDFFHKPPPVK